MPKYLPKKSKLIVISDTAMSGIPDKIAAFEPVVREIDRLSEGFKSVDWLGYRWYSSSPVNHKIPSSKILSMIGVHATGGNTFKEKVSVLIHLPEYLSKINYLIKKNNIVYTRGPSVPALLVILLSFFIKNKIYLHKYAGGWDLKSVPFSYSFQRWLLKKQKRGYVLVSSTVLNDYRHIVCLPNPCLEKKEIQTGCSAMKSKIYSNGLRICFVGNCGFYKGIFDVLDIDMGADTNRTVVTFIGNPNIISEAAFQGVKRASELIDMRTHEGTHPRMGATDVCPFIPVANVSMDDCIEIAKKTAQRVGTELNIPVYLYELATLFHAYWNLGRDNSDYRFIKNNNPASNTKLIILKSISFVIKSGMNLIGVSTPNKM